MDQIDIDEIGLRGKIKEEAERFKSFQQALLGKKEKIIVANIDIRNYAKYLMREGKDIEKRELLSCLKGKIVLNEKKISLS
jgi:hypothetical protein